MPELPEVETIVRGLARRVTGNVVESVWLGQKKQSFKSPAAEIAATLERSRIAAVRRMGKHIVFDLERDRVGRAVLPAKSRGSNRKMKDSSTQASATPQAEAGRACPEPVEGSARPTQALADKACPELAEGSARPTQSQWIVHLGMTGRLQVCEPQTKVEKHTHAIVRLSSGRELRFVDPRRFGRLSVAPAGGFDAGGVEPLEVGLDRFIALFRGRKTPIKSALLNQKLLRGVGNIYADESLFRAGIRPRRRAATITREQLGRLFLAVKEVLQEAIALGGSSISDYVDANGEQGFFQLQHRVYGRAGEPCLACETPVKRVLIAGRSSHYCPKCQK